MSSTLTALTIATALGCGLVAGFFFAFSACVMQALGELPPAHGIAAMQRINVVVINGLVMTAIFGTGVLCLALIAVTIADWDGSYGPFLLVAAAIYIAGSVIVTMMANVPRNDELERLEPTSAAAASYWQGYLREWTAWNHVRTITPLIACGLAIAALIV